MTASFSIRPNERTRITGDQDERHEFADDVEPHAPWRAHAHPFRRPCYCWHRGEVMPESPGENADGLGQRPRLRWFLMHFGHGTEEHPFEGGWRLYDRKRLDRGEPGSSAGPWDVLRSEAARLADVFIEHVEAMEANAP